MHGVILENTAMNFSKILLTIVSLCLCGRCLADEWKSHTNERFGIRISYPANLKPGRMPDNGAGQTFSDGKFSVTVQGHFTGGTTLEDFWKQSLSSYGKSISYKHKKENGFVVSGVLPDGTEFYKKLHVQGGNWAGFTATYPHAMNKTYDPVIEHMAKSFQPFLSGKYGRLP